MDSAVSTLSLRVACAAARGLTSAAARPQRVAASDGGLPGHDDHRLSHASIGAEKTGNPRVAGGTLAEFQLTMNELHLPRTRRTDQALPANQVSGPRQDAGGEPASQPRPAQGYAGDVPPKLAFQWWQQGDAVLVDVRTDAEREWVGFIPGAVPLAWKQWPGMAINSGFDEGLKAAVPPGKKVVLLCRSGVRSIAAARRATELGLEAYNILEGFEGDPDEHAQRGRKGGWRLHGLPWRQG
jgi:rhodanese-related sulfurtransferase